MHANPNQFDARSSWKSPPPANEESKFAGSMTGSETIGRSTAGDVILSKIFPLNGTEEEVQEVGYVF